MLDYYAFLSLEMVMPDQVEAIRKSQKGVVGWRYRPEKHILDLLFETDIENEQARRDAIAAGQTIYMVMPGQRMLFHLPTHESILEEIADAAENLVDNAISCNEHEFNPDGYYIDAESLDALSRLLEKLQTFDEAVP